MKKEIEIAVSYEKVISKKKEIDFPEIEKYYSKNDDDNRFSRDIILFAILPRFKTNPTKSYLLIEVERNKQDFNDFVPSDDCKQNTWVTKYGIRQKALNIITGEDYEFKEITKEEFEFKRLELLNDFTSTHNV